jgi:peptidoglycan/LPS O-acetylase OafA/YrhL
MTSSPTRPDALPALPRLAFLDGLRGLAAGYVVLHHAALLVPPDQLSPLMLPARFLLRHGHSAVAVFIVASGFCLMRAIVRDTADAPRFFDYLGRRARRILPPYYAALFLSCLAIAFIPPLGHATGARWDRALPALKLENVLAHIALVHNVDLAWLYKIDPPMWCVATEWQLYLLFPLLVAVWRRWGVVSLVSVGFALGYGVAALAMPLHNLALRDLCPWYAGLFTLGMTAAVASSSGLMERWRSPLIPSVLLGLLAIFAATRAMSVEYYRSFMISDPLVGLATAALLVRWTNCRERVRCQQLPALCSTAAAEASFPPLRSGGKRGGRFSLSPLPSQGGESRGVHRMLLVRLLETPALIGLGKRSYSLYLIHYPLLALADAALRGMAFSPSSRLLALLTLAAPLCLVAADLFHRAFERPFLSPGARGHAASPHMHAHSGREPSRTADVLRSREMPVHG